MNQHVSISEPMILTIGERLAEECRVQGMRHAADVTDPRQLLDSTGRLRPEFEYFANFVILIPEGAERLRDTIASPV